MRNSRVMISGILLAIMVIMLSGCKIISASPDPGAVIEMKPGDKQLFKVEGPVNTSTTRCLWTISRRGIDYYYYKEFASMGKNEFELDLNPDFKLSNKIIITCSYQFIGLVWESNPQSGWGLQWEWVTTDSRDWEVMVKPNSATVITGDYIIENDSDLQMLKGYTTVTGSLIIGPSIESLEGLESLTTIGEGFGISDNATLTSLAGLENLTSVGGNFWIGHPHVRGNHALTSLSGLNNLTSIGGNLYIYGNAVLTSLTGLENLTSIVRDLYIDGNDALTSLTGLDNLTSIDGDLEIGNIIEYGGNNALTSLIGLENIKSVGGGLWIYENQALTSLSGLENITSVGILDIEYNGALMVLGMAGLQRVDGKFEISSNLLLCKSLAEELMNQVLAGEGIGGSRNIEGNKECTTP